jgi:hypothetical protein
LAIQNEPDRFGDFVLGEPADQWWPPRSYPVVIEPENVVLRPVVYHAEALTFKANNLLFEVLDGPLHVPSYYPAKAATELMEDIREMEQRRSGLGWIRWLQATTRHQTNNAFANYAQVAATALVELRSWCGPGQPDTTNGEWVPASKAVQLAQEKGYKIDLPWLSKSAARNGVKTRPKQLPGKHSLEVEWNSLAGYLLRNAPAKTGQADEPGSDEPELRERAQIEERMRQAKEKKGRDRPLD